MVFIILLALFFGVPTVEIAVFIKAGAAIGVFNTIAFTFFTAFLGVVLVRWQGLQALEELRRAMEEGRPPVLEIVSGALLVLAGILLLIPGFVTDALGFLLLIPPLRKGLAALFLARMAARAEVRAHAEPGVTIIEAEIVDEEPPAPPRLDGREERKGPGSPWRED